jgi:hypothetical protein
MDWVMWKRDGHKSSWHRVAFESRGGIPKAVCGRWANHNAKIIRASTYDPNDKTCESCLRLTAKPLPPEDQG